MHKDYQAGKSHDIALIKLIKPVNDVKPAKLYDSTDELAKITWFIGVGGTGNGLSGQTIDHYQNGGILGKAQNKIVQAAATVADRPVFGRSAGYLANSPGQCGQLLSQFSTTGVRPTAR